MKKTLFISAIILGVYSCGSSEKKVTEKVTETVAKNERHTKDSLIEVNNKKQVVRVRDTEGNYMFLDKNAEILSGTKLYLGAEDFIGGYAAVEISEGKWGMINSIGEVVSKSYDKYILFSKTLEKGRDRTIALNYANSEPEFGDTTLVTCTNYKKAYSYLEDQGYNDSWGNPAVKQIYVPERVTVAINGKDLGEVQNVFQFHKVKGSELKDYVKNEKIKQEVLRNIQVDIDGMSYLVTEAESVHKRISSGSVTDMEYEVKLRDSYVQRALKEYYFSIRAYVPSSLTTDHKRKVNILLKRIKAMGIDPEVAFLE